MKKLTLFFLGALSTFFLYPQTPGTLNLSFGNNGIAFNDFNNKNNISYASVIQPDGKILLAGRTSNYDVSWPTLMRYDAEGDLDPSFGSNGIKAFIPVNAKEYIEGMILQPDGKILAIGYRNANDTTRMQLFRLNPDGSFDNTFYGTGHRTIEFGLAYETFGYDLALQDDGKILAVGLAMDMNQHVQSAICRINADGSMDESFGFNGIVIMDFGNMHNYTNNIALQDDKIIVGGISYPFSGGEYDYVTLARFNSNGILDASFGQSGVVNIEFYLDAWISMERGDMCLDNQGRILYGVYVAGIQSLDFAIFRFLPDGPPDNSFGQYGLTVTDMEKDATIQALAIQNDGKILAGGYQSSANGGCDFALVRYRDDGSLDPGFGTDYTGIVITEPNTGASTPFGIITSLNIGPNNLIMAGGYVTNYAGNNDFALAAYYSGLSVDISSNENERFGLSVFPNPFEEETLVRFELQERTYVKAFVVDLYGQHVAIISERYFAPGSHYLSWNAEGLAPGIYFLCIRAGEKAYTSKLIKN